MTQEKSSKVNSLILRLMEPYLDKGHQLYIDNFYTNLQLSECLQERKTHTTGTLHSNRKRNPKEITEAKLRAREHVWRSCGNIYVSKWRDKRGVLAFATGYQPKLIETTNKYGLNKVKPIEVAGYNDRADQMISYYSCPRKSIRWNKKVIFHILDIVVWNAYYLYKETECNKTNSFDYFRSALI
ncbi:hypothetical protein NQ314_006949 [Rhamnusium bicolor]|uniref:PiggyBac transposable element-derived protein domain-containing protein n=1 Tax=Rhamnusium bicolor TaxID=1586634 RepID=A0AAV8YVT4_9CUCU|nr:hypothetical protein NQ314_006949 [Rhamnusium bicolor]